MNNEAYFHFTLGPVQSFISQARRARDFWAGSFLLSWLSGVAMQEVIAQNHGKIDTILYPLANQNFLDYLQGKDQGEKPQQGCIPNRFKARVGQGFRPEAVADAVNTAWHGLAEKIFSEDIANISVENIKRSKKIWDRQVEHFWEVNWAITASPEGDDPLSQRKYWRSHYPSAEGGVKCMMIDGLQELSGEPRPIKERQDKFWNAVLQNGKPGIKTDIRTGERLCAIAFIKRRFSRCCHFQKLEVPMSISMQSSWSLQGWELDSPRPSVSYMAAVHWLEHLVEQAGKSSDIANLLTDFYNATGKLTNQHNEYDNNIHCIQTALEKNPHIDEEWFARDGNMFFSSTLESDYVLDDTKQNHAIAASEKLRVLQRKLNRKASPFYAVLVMDGDNLGVQLRDSHNAQIIAKALDTFTQNVQKVVKASNGFLIYAGGDDVLAILPLEDAIPCALELRKCYMGAFDATSLSQKQSISAAICYPYIKTPLTSALAQAHTLLDDIAKERTGRNAIAIQVIKPGGKGPCWSMPWQRAVTEANDTLVLDALAQDLASNDIERRQFSGRFLHKLSTYFNVLTSEDDGKEAFTRESINNLLIAEYLSSGACEHIPKADRQTHAKKVVAHLLTQCYPMRSKPNGGGFEAAGPPSSDAALLLRFLAQKGVE